jgi:hypothetical protein
MGGSELMLNKFSGKSFVCNLDKANVTDAGKDSVHFFTTFHNSKDLMNVNYRKWAFLDNYKLNAAGHTNTLSAVIAELIEAVKYITI